ncbi:MAG: LacI family DNA-binding transcriptional regulator [Verrucomicrobia bacterium]|nr:LacI family DNA-binding transcriptional regulator [Verrucomicrobiota bacterium]
MASLTTEQHPPDDRPPTIRDVARLAQVSLGTASKALNGSGKLRAETRLRVQTVASELGFRPNEWALSLHRRRTFTIGLISTDSFGRFSIPVLAGIEHALKEANISVFLCNAADDPELERRHLEALLAKRVDGIIITSRRTDPRPPIAADRTRVPVVYAYAQTSHQHSWQILPDDQSGGKLATEHLIQTGRQRIVHVTGPDSFLAVRQRAEGFRQAMRAARLPLPARSVLMGAWSENWGHVAVAKLLRVRARFDAVFCGSDQIARGCADALREAGISVPNQVAIVGYDNWEIIAAATRPPLTTVDMNLQELGGQAGKILIGLIDGQKPAETILVPPRLIVRASCGSFSRATGDTDKR